MVSLLLVCWLSYGTIVAQATFKTDRLQRAATLLGLVGQMDSLPENQTLHLKASDGRKISVRTDRQRSVEHIGIPLFRDDLRALMPSPVYDFLEYAVLNWKYQLSPNQLYLSKVIFKKGSWGVLADGSLNDCDCSISNEDDRLYIVTWQRKDDEELAVVGIPIEYELLNNDTRRNMERNFIGHLIAHQPQDSTRLRKVVTMDDLKLYGTEGLFVVEGESYLLPELNQNVYYVLTTIYEKIDTVYKGEPVTMTLEDVVPALVINPEFPAETFADLMLSDCVISDNVQLNLDFHLSDYHRQMLNLPLKQLRDYCRQQGDEVYFACSSLTGEVVRGILMIHNAAKGYNHLLSLSLALDQLTASTPEVQAAVFLFIPPIDKTHLFGVIPTQKSGAKIY